MKKTIAMVALAATGSAMAADKITHSADFRYRTEMKKVEKDAGGEKNYTHNSMRLRVGVDYKVNKETTLHTRFATTGGNTTTAVQNNSKAKELYVDRAYVSHTCSDTGLTAAAGRQANPFIVTSELTFDKDFNPEGISAGYEIMGVTLTVGNFWIKTDGALNSNDVALNAAQLSYAGKAGSVGYAVGLSHYNFDGRREADATKNNIAQNEIFVSAKFDVGMPLTVFASSITNDGEEDDNAATEFGIKTKFGKTGLALSSLTAGVNSLNDVTSSNNFAGATATEELTGMNVKLSHKLSENSKVKLSHYTGEDSKKKDVYSKTKFDIVVKF